VWDVTGQKGVMLFANLPPLAADKDYQMWIIDPRYAAPVSAGIITAGSDEDLEVKFTPTREIAMADKFAVSVEQKGGSPTPLGQIVLMSN
jgi:anti-sigma-K factor RskA